MILESCLAISIFTTKDFKVLVEVQNTFTKETVTRVYENDLDAGAHIQDLEDLVIKMQKGCSI